MGVVTRTIVRATKLVKTSQFRPEIVIPKGNSRLSNSHASKSQQSDEQVSGLDNHTLDGNGFCQRGVFPSGTASVSFENDIGFR
jgi:hypothetical protein